MAVNRTSVQPWKQLHAVTDLLLEWGLSSTVMTGGQAVLSKLSALKLDVGVSAHSPSSSTSFRFFENKSLIVS